ncbi:hypothetical protein NQ318_008750 [Aromia moschata]|uniref:Carboxylesterase type B domain-containing protein n=1 Tax=Aromia moschata TaxID=1265417 RepID=A0AAV8ZA20_9CUCU|nr:hypothetical protein NQ318_008750 [Aromia moschata]
MYRVLHLKNNVYLVYPEKTDDEKQELSLKKNPFLLFQLDKRRIQTGAIRGVILELNSRHLEPVEVFRGVPYAAPPAGPLRFRPPQPPLPWPGTRLADTFGAACPQKYPDVSNRTAALLSMPKGRYQYLKKLVPLLVNQVESDHSLTIYDGYGYDPPPGSAGFNHE